MIDRFAPVVPLSLAEANSMDRYGDIDEEHRAALAEWIRAWVRPSRRIFEENSYHLKHRFERSAGGFYVFNGAFKVAMLEAGYDPVNRAGSYWRFRMKMIEPRPVRSKSAGVRSTVPASLRFEVLSRSGFRCVYCGRSAREVTLHVDHVRSVFDGGDTTDGNLAAACRECNLGKGAVSVRW